MEKKSLGAFIAVLRKAKGLTQKQLAEMLNVSDKAVSRWERNEAQPDLTVIPILADLFGVTADELLRGYRNPLANDAVASHPVPISATNIISIVLGILGYLFALFFHYRDKSVFWSIDHRFLAFLLACGFYIAAGSIQTLSMIHTCRQSPNLKEHTVHNFLNFCALLLSLLAGSVPILIYSVSLQELLIYTAALSPSIYCILLRINWFLTKPMICKRTGIFQAELQNHTVSSLRRSVLFRDTLICGILGLVLWTDQFGDAGNAIILLLLILELPVSTLCYLWKKRH